MWETPKPAYGLGLRRDAEDAELNAEKAVAEKLLTKKLLVVKALENHKHFL